MKQVDKLGRIVIPLELREKYGLTAGTEVEFLAGSDGVVVKSAGALCKICRTRISDGARLPLCIDCISKIKAYDE